jgi:cyclase
MYLPFLALALTGQDQHPKPTEAKDYASTYERKVTKVADGVYVIRHPEAPDQFPQGNTTVVIGNKSVLVVDSCYLPSAARQDIAQIRKWTKKPVRYLLNTHWHYDHTLGNGTYAAAFPGLQIIAHAETQKHIKGYNPGWFKRYPERTASLRHTADTGKDDAGQPVSEETRKAAADALSGRDKVWAEFSKIVDRAPDRYFQDSLTLNLGGRTAKLMHLGRGNTTGDALVYLPKEKIVVTGDLVDHPIPYLGGGFPSEQIGTLKRLDALDFKALVPGHGEVLHSKVFLHKLIEFITVVVNQVGKEVYRIGNSSAKLDEVQQSVTAAIDLPKWRKFFAGDDKDNQDFFDSFSYPGLVKAAYAEMWRR